ncbi:MAG TPA: hypothetical protein VEA36_03855, partial [Candidatus Paceibacterota bacterium]|nr:hypothetical protein [Candidatus Paceibacterota bacterium]
MAALSEHLERIREKPHHVRRQIAFGTSLTITALVAIGWVGALVSTPKLAIDPNLADEELSLANAPTMTGGSFSELVGAAGAAFGATTSPAKVMVVDTKTSSTLDVKRDNHNDTKE